MRRRKIMKYRGFDIYMERECIVCCGSEYDGYVYRIYKNGLPVREFAGIVGVDMADSSAEEAGQFARDVIDSGEK